MPGLMRGGWKRGRVSGSRACAAECRDSAGPPRLPRQSPTLRASCKAHDDLPVKVRPKEAPRHLCSSPPAFGETRASKRGVEPSLGGCKPPVRSIKRSLPRRQENLLREPTGSRARACWAKAMEGVKHLGMQHRRTLRRKGRGTVAQSSWEQERPVSAPAAVPDGVLPDPGTGSSEPYKRCPRERGKRGAGVGAAHSTAEVRDNITRAEGRGRTWSACLVEVSAGDCRQG
jgi:hypothetical protein